MRVQEAAKFYDKFISSEYSRVLTELKAATLVGKPKVVFDFKFQKDTVEKVKSLGYKVKRRWFGGTVVSGWLAFSNEEETV